jgi:hypothetical protein
VNGLWRFSDSAPVRLLSRALCLAGRHVWIWYGGRPASCGVCGRPGHPLAVAALGARIRACLGEEE